MPDATSLVGINTSPGSSASVSQSIPSGTILCSSTYVTLAVTNDCGDATNVIVPVVLEACCCQPTTNAVVVPGPGDPGWRACRMARRMAPTSLRLNRRHHIPAVLRAGIFSHFPQQAQRRMALRPDTSMHWEIQAISLTGPMAMRMEYPCLRRRLHHWWASFWTITIPARKALRHRG